MDPLNLWLGVKGHHNVPGAVLCCFALKRNPDRTVKARLQEVQVTGSKFADDVCNHQGHVGVDCWRICQDCSRMGPHSQLGKDEVAHNGEAAGT